jgi:starch phosphorylase
MPPGQPSKRKVSTMARANEGGIAAPGREPTRTGLSVQTLKRAFLDNLLYVQARFPEVATPNDFYQAFAHTVRDRLLQRWVQTARAYKDRGSRTVCYFSAEYLLGPHLGNNLLNLGILEEARQALAELGLSLDALMEEEEEPGLGNGGLGRLAACYMDSLATLQIPAIGYGIRYEFGIFDQAIQDGWQVERTDKWLSPGNPWEVPRPEITFEVGFGGHTEQATDADGRLRVRWVPERVVKGMAYDTPILGYGVDNANLLRLWSAEAPESFDFQAFNVGDYYRAVDQKVASESLTKVLYPNDEPEAGKRLRLEQQYFFVSCALRDMIRIYHQRDVPLDRLHEKYVVQLNDTHPAIAVAELMRLLVDEHGMGWEAAWAITTRTFAYTNHTLLPEALERWPVALFERVLPRHLELIYEINRRFLDELRAQGADEGRIARLSLIDEAGGRSVRMANLACVGSFAVNGVAALHTELLKAQVLADFHALWPQRFGNKTNGVTPRRFVVLANPGLAGLLDEVVGPGWERDGERLRGLEERADDPAFQADWRQVKRANKAHLADDIARRTGIRVDPDSLFDIQVKRIHEYKRQHLTLLHAVTLYQRLKADPGQGFTPRTLILAGKAAPGYYLAKLIIRLATAIAAVVNADPDVAGRLRVVFLPDFNVKRAQRVYPAADLSEQVSLAGKEASGTGNMKMAMNGALTIGTLDGANVEIREAVGADNFFLFGLDAEGVQRTRAAGYDPRNVYEQDPELRAAMDAIASGAFSPGQPDLFRPLTDALLERDDYLALADYRAYLEAQERVAKTYLDHPRWTRMSILNVARMGRFSSDRAIREYCRDIWHVDPVPVQVRPMDPAASAAQIRAAWERQRGG